MSDAKLLLDAKVFLGEGPIWDLDTKKLWWINIFDGELFCFDPATGDNTRYGVGQQIGAVVIQESGGLAVALENGFYSFDPLSNKLDPICDPEADKPDNRFNDGKCDPAGRFWAGTMEKAEVNATGSLYCLEGTGNCRQMETGVSISNGIAWSGDGSKMYYIDSPTRRVDQFEFDRETAKIRSRKKAIEIPDGMGYPDGMAIDSEDKLWVAMWDGWCVARFCPTSGELMEKIELPVANVTACAFGGDHLDELFITTARKGNSDAELKEQPHAGSLFHAKVDVRGTVFPKFRR